MFSRRALEERTFQRCSHLSDEIGIHFQKFEPFSGMFATLIRRHNIVRVGAILDLFFARKVAKFNWMSIKSSHRWPAQNSARYCSLNSPCFVSFSFSEKYSQHFFRKKLKKKPGPKFTEHYLLTWIHYSWRIYPFSRPPGPPLTSPGLSHHADGLFRPSAFWRENRHKMPTGRRYSYRETGCSRCWLVKSQTRTEIHFYCCRDKPWDMTFNQWDVGYNFIKP